MLVFQTKVLKGVFLLKNFKQLVKQFMPSFIWNVLRQIKKCVHEFIDEIVIFPKRIVVLVKSIISFFTKEPDNFKYNFAIAAIIKNEGRYIEEWIKYHVLVGVEKFYLYNNESTDDTEKILKPYIESGLVDLIYFPGKCKQRPAFRDALKRYRSECKYMALIDGDEFLRPMDKNKTVYEVIDEICTHVKNIKRVCGVIVPWRNFGSSGYVKIPTGGA